MKVAADAAVSPFYYAGVYDERRRRRKEEEENAENARKENKEELTCSDFQPPSVKVIETTHDAGKKAD